MAVSRPLLVILGPTASGQSDLAMAVARRTGAEILSLDSMQVYRGMDVGTAKPTPAERAEVRHHLIDVVEPSEEFTVARFVELADATIADAAARAKPLIGTGGTPLYYKALFEGLFDGPPADPAVRDRLREQGGEVLHRRLTEVDPQAAARIHANDTRRVIRALEVYELTGRPITSFQTDWTAPSHRHAAVWVGLNWDKDVLNRRINARVKAMIAAGWVEETRTLLADVASDLGTDLSIDLEPAGDVSGEMRARGACGKRDTTPDSISATKSTANDAQRAERWAGELEQGWRRWVEVRVDEAHLGADVAPAITESSRGCSRAVEPSKSRQSERSGIASEEERRVGRPCDRWERRANGGERAFVAELRQRRKSAVVYRTFEHIRTCSIGEKNDDGQGVDCAVRNEIRGNLSYASLPDRDP